MAARKRAPRQPIGRRTVRHASHLRNPHYCCTQPTKRNALASPYCEQAARESSHGHQSHGMATVPRPSLVDPGCRGHIGRGLQRESVVRTSSVLGLFRVRDRVCRCPLGTVAPLWLGQLQAGRGCVPFMGKHLESQVREPQVLTDSIFCLYLSFSKQTRALR